MAAIRWTHPGLFRHEVLYERNQSLDEAADDSDTLDSFGQPIANWVSYSAAMARIKTLDGSEPVTANQAFPEATHQLFHTFVEGIRVRDRINFNGRIFAVLHINNVESLNREQRVLCTEQVT